MRTPLTAAFGRGSTRGTHSKGSAEVQCQSRSTFRAHPSSRLLLVLKVPKHELEMSAVLTGDGVNSLGKRKSFSPIPDKSAERVEIAVFKVLRPAPRALLQKGFAHRFFRSPSWHQSSARTFGINFGIYVVPSGLFGP
jgi:hypothetical protein